jgi:hypothetical protein
MGRIPGRGPTAQCPRLARTVSTWPTATRGVAHDHAGRSRLVGRTHVGPQCRPSAHGARSTHAHGDGTARAARPAEAHRTRGRGTLRHGQRQEGLRRRRHSPATRLGRHGRRSGAAAQGESNRRDYRDTDTAAALDSTAASHRARLRTGGGGASAREVSSRRRTARLIERRRRRLQAETVGTAMRRPRPRTGLSAAH